MAVNATAVWRVRPSGNNLNGGGYDAGISGAATDYSQQNAAQTSGSAGTATGTTTFSDAVANSFTAAMVGNAIQIASGVGFTAGFYFVTAFTSSTTVTLDRSPGTGTVAVWKLGGGWADFWTNTTSTGPLVGGNTIYILGSGTPNPSSYIYDYTAPTFTPITPTGITTLTFANDPGTPGYKAFPDTTGGMPVIKFTGAQIFNVEAASANSLVIRTLGLWFVGGAGISAGSYVLNSAASSIAGGTSAVAVMGCVLDQFGFDIGMAQCTGPGSQGGAIIYAFGAEVFSSVSASVGTNAAFFSNYSAFNVHPTILVYNCNIHDCISYGIYGTVTGSFRDFTLTVEDTIIAKCGVDGIYCDTYDIVTIKNCTIDGSAGSGINFGSLIGLFFTETVWNNIISNHTGAGKFGINFQESAPTVAKSTLFVDYNAYYNNSTDLSNSVPYSPHDTHGGANPYVNSAIENYTLA
jgi:hypothetical protein